MLYLTLPTVSSCESASHRLPLSNSTALAFERALLETDLACRHRGIAAALAGDPKVAAWAMRCAEISLGRTINRVDEAADWLAAQLEPVLADALSSDSTSQSGDIDWRLPALVARLSHVARQLEEFNARLEREKLESLKELAYGASHEINNPLANIAARAQTLLDGEHDDERRRKLIAIHRQAMRAHEMISDLMLFARPPKLSPVPCDLGPIVNQILDEYRDEANERGISLSCDLADEHVEAWADDTQIRVAIAALVRNSIEAVGINGHVRVTLAAVAVGDQRFAEIAVIDDGPGISPRIREHMFDPFFSGREAGRGLGFGLSKCWRIVTDHGGQVAVRSKQSVGAEIAILLPLAAELDAPG